MSTIGNSYFDRMPELKPSQEALDKRAFDEEINRAAERIIDLVPDLLADILDGEAARLADLIPKAMRKPDSVTREVFDEKAVRRFLAGKVGNKLGRGLNWLNK